MPWFIKTKDGERGPFPSTTLKELVSSGKLNERVLIRRDGQAGWMLAGSIDGLFPSKAEVPESPQVMATARAVISSVASWTEAAGKLIPPVKAESAIPVPAVIEQPIDPILAKLTADEQPSQVIEKLLPKVRELLTSSEDLFYIAVQAKPLINLTPDCVVLTNRRFMIVRPKLLGRLDFRCCPVSVLL